MSERADQEIFRSVYRGRQSALHHMAYMRMAKVLLALRALDSVGYDLAGKRILDYAFGAGTFLRYCPRDAQLYGVEIDPVNVAAVRDMLRARGATRVELEPISLERWSEHPLLTRQYDLIVCSHVLEHLAEPAEFLRVMRRCLAPGALLLGLVLINELAADPHHVQRVDRGLLERWAGQSALETLHYIEADELYYYLQPLVCRATGIGHKLVQAGSLALGVPATLLGPKSWWRVSELAGRMTGAKPAQAAVVLRATQDRSAH